MKKHENFFLSTGPLMRYAGRCLERTRVEWNGAKYPLHTPTHGVIVSGGVKGQCQSRGTEGEAQGSSKVYTKL